LKTIGLIGGMSWESTATYYAIVNTIVKEKLGDLHSARCLLYSVDFQEIEACQAADDWAESARILCGAAQALERAGADFLVICTNTMHKVVPEVEKAVSIPLLHIADATAGRLLSHGIKTVALLGTRYTMEQNFYKSRLIERGLDVRIPSEAERAEIHRIIYDELCLGIRKDESRYKLQQILDRLAQAGAQGAILGCTELGLLVQDGDAALPLFDTAHIHAEEAALISLA